MFYLIKENTLHHMIVPMRIPLLQNMCKQKFCCLDRQTLRIQSQWTAFAGLKSTHSARCRLDIVYKIATAIYFSFNGKKMLLSLAGVSIK